MKIGLVGTELFRADRQTDMTNLVLAFRNFTNAPKSIAKLQFSSSSVAWRCNSFVVSELRNWTEVIPVGLPVQVLV